MFVTSGQYILQSDKGFWIYIYRSYCTILSVQMINHCLFTQLLINLAYVSGKTNERYHSVLKILVNHLQIWEVLQAGNKQSKFLFSLFTFNLNTCLQETENFTNFKKFTSSRFTVHFSSCLFTVHHARRVLELVFETYGSKPFQRGVDRYNIVNKLAVILRCRSSHKCIQTYRSCLLFAGRTVSKNRVPTETQKHKFTFRSMGASYHVAPIQRTMLPKTSRSDVTISKLRCNLLTYLGFVAVFVSVGVDVSGSMVGSLKPILFICSNCY